MNNNPWAGYNVPKDYEYTPDGPPPEPKPIRFFSWLFGKRR